VCQYWIRTRNEIPPRRAVSTAFHCLEPWIDGQRISVSYWDCLFFITLIIWNIGWEVSEPGQLSVAGYAIDDQGSITSRDRTFSLYHRVEIGPFISNLYSYSVLFTHKIIDYSFQHSENFCAVHVECFNRFTTHSAELDMCSTSGAWFTAFICR
jgi:hypothetical protein